MTIPKFELGIIASRSTPHPCLKQYSSKPLGKMFTCNLKAFANVLELLVANIHLNFLKTCRKYSKRGGKKGARIDNSLNDGR